MVYFLTPVFMKKLNILLATLLAVVLLAACSGSNSSATVPSDTTPDVAPVADIATPDACKYLTKEIAETVVGPIDSAPKTDGTSGAIGNCMYLSKDFSAVSLLIKANTSADEFQKGFEMSKSISGVDPVKVDGLGESAFWAAGKLNQMNILKGGNMMIVMIMGVKGDFQAVAKDVADKVLAAM